MRSGLALAIGFMFLCGVVFALLGGPLAAFFSNDPMVIANALSGLMSSARAVQSIARCVSFAGLVLQPLKTLSTCHLPCHA